jgi:hypothetical protein
MIDLQKIQKENKRLKEKKKSKDSKSILNKLKGVVTAKPILKSERATITIKEREPAEYEPIFFKKEMEEAKKSLFFS